MHLPPAEANSGNSVNDLHPLRAPKSTGNDLQILEGQFKLPCKLLKMLGLQTYKVEGRAGGVGILPQPYVHPRSADLDSFVTVVPYKGEGDLGAGRVVLSGLKGVTSRARTLKLFSQVPNE